MWGTRHKLEETRFFLGQLEEHCYDKLKAHLIDDNAAVIFPYYLSAFISAARSVTWIMRSEYGAFDGWEVWWKSQAPEASMAELLQLFTRLRNRSQKAE